ncbi:MAG: hypothetical protein IJW30_05140 [Clostridia bacterium]|nr:hypothetical protein [Clostridia bacterium]
MKRLRSILDQRRREKKKKIVADGPRNEYYETVSARFGIAQVILYLLLLAFVVVSFLFNTELITYQNFYYFFQDLGASAENVDTVNTGSLSYPTAREQGFTLYRGGLAVAGNNSVTVFSATGRQIVSETVNYSHPVAVGSGKYLLVYEMGGMQYSLYTSYQKIHSGKTAYPIHGAAISDSGMYALISATDSSTSAVLLFNDRFQQTMEYEFGRAYVNDVAINENGTRVAILATDSVNGRLESRVKLAKPGEGEAMFDQTVSASVGLACTVTSSGRIAVLCGDGVYYLNERGETVESEPHDTLTPSYYAIGKDGIAVSLKKNTVSEKNVVRVFDKNGKKVYNGDVAQDIEAVAYSGDSVFWMTRDGVVRLSLDSGTVTHQAASTVGKRLLAVSEAEVLLCSAQKAEYISFRSR